MFLDDLGLGSAPVFGVEPSGHTSGMDAYCKCLKRFGGPGRVRTDDLFHAMEARSQLRHRPLPRIRWQVLSIYHTGTHRMN